MSPFDHTSEIFRQLADMDGSAGVKTMIETHDAWVHNFQSQAGITAAVRAQLARTLRPESVSRRIAQQCTRLGAVVVCLPQRLSSAG